jgi:membrane protein implicated in regulation of membrane protease activity
VTGSIATLWWVIAGVLIATELASGTFYLLMLALGATAAAVAAHLGLAPSWQIAVAALVGGGATALWHWRRAQQPRSAPAAQNRDVNLDIGERVHVAEWASDRTTRVNHRGTSWAARLQPQTAAQAGPHHIVAIEGNWLVLAPADGH